MPRRLRIDLGGIVYHVLNRRAGRVTLFEKDEDYASFVNVLDEASQKLPMRVVAWPWSSLPGRQGPDRCEWLLPIRDWPVTVPRSWKSFVNRPETDEELAALRRSAARGSPCGDADWQKRSAVRLRLESSLRDPWRPKKPGRPRK